VVVVVVAIEPDGSAAVDGVSKPLLALGGSG
jgi:hypothetical protein